MSAERNANALGKAKREGQQWRCLCPAHDDHTPSLYLRDTHDGRVLWHCKSGCTQTAVGHELRRRGLIGDERERRRAYGAVKPKPLINQSSKLDYLLSKLLPIEGTLVETYLHSRGLDLPPDGHQLRCLPANPPKFVWPCMVGIITDFADANRMLSLHFTRLRPDGLGKAPLPKSKQRSYLKDFAKKGGVIRLCADADVTMRLGIAEGVETALAVTTTFRRDESRFEPVWAALDADNLGGLPVVPGIETIEIYADRGPAGEQKANGLAQRWLEAGREVFITVAPVDDWNPAVAS